MARIAILAFGSLIEDPGKEIGALISDRIEGVATPFSIEFARSSGTRCGAPTLIPVDDGGSSVKAVLLVLDSAVGLQQAETLLWRRETRNEFSKSKYSRPHRPWSKSGSCRGHPGLSRLRCCALHENWREYREAVSGPPRGLGHQQRARQRRCEQERRDQLSRLGDPPGNHHTASGRVQGCNTSKNESRRP